MRKTEETKLMIINNFIDYFTTNEEERDQMKKNALVYVEEDWVDEIEQSGFKLITEKSLVIENVKRILCGLDNDDDVREAVRKIVNYPNQTNYIDWVDDIVVWCKLSNTYTCEEFLDEIEYYENFENDLDN